MATLTLRPNAAGDETNLTPNDTNNYAMVEEITADETATMVSTNSTKRDLYNLPASPSTISGKIINHITVYARCKSNDVSGAFAGVGIAIKSDSTVTEDTKQLTTTSWANYSKQWTTNPADSAAWAWADIDTLQIGVNLYSEGGAGYFTYCTQVYVVVDFIEPVTYVHQRHDIGILRSDDTTTKVGLMLVQQKGVPLYRTVIERYLKNQYYAALPGYGALDPQSELPIIQDGFRSGMGLEVADSADPERYFSSIGMDGSNKGMFIAGPTPTAQAVPDKDHIPDIVNDDMELETGWDVSDAAASFSAADKKTGAQSIRIDSGSGNPEADQYIVGWTPGVQYTFTCWVKGFDATNAGRIGIDDGVSPLYSTYIESATWTEKTIQITVDASAKYLRLVLYTKQGNLSRPSFFDDASITMDDSSGASTYTGVTRAFAEFNDNLFYSLNKYLIMVDHTDGVSHLVAQFTANITDLEPFTDDHLYIALGLSTAYEDLSILYEPTTNTGTYINMQFLKTVFTTADTMYGNDSNNEIRSTVDPSESGTDFSNPATTVGSDANDITGLAEKSGALYIAKQDTTYYLDSSGNVQNDLAPELKSDTATTSGKAIFLWKKKLYINAGDQVLLETDGTTNTFRNPANYCTNLSDFVGAIQGLAGDGFWLFAIIDNGTKAEVLKGRDETIGSTTSWVWHPFAEIPATFTACERAFVSNVYQKRLWISSTTSGESLYYIPLPAGYGDIENDANRKFKTGTYFITPYYHGNFKGEDKAWIKITLTMGHTYNASRYFTVHYQTLEGSEVSVGNFTGVSGGSMVESRYIDVTNKPVSSMMRFKVTAVTDNTNFTPILLSMDVRAILRPTHRKIIECAVRCADGIIDKKNLPLEGTNAAYIRTVLDEARDASWPFTFYDLWGNTKYGIVLPTDTESEVMAALKNENPELFYYLRIQEVALA